MSINDSLSVKKIDSSLQVLLEESPHDIEIPEKIADEIFQVACQDKPLYNGTLVCVKSFSPQLITGYTVSFKNFLASYHLGYRNLHHPLAVSGWVRHGDKILFGIRSEKVLFSPKLIELVPSGGVDDSAIEGNKINFEYALITEFEQETGLLQDVIESTRAELIVYCKEKCLYDICMSMVLKSDEDIYCDDFNDEYTDLFWVPINEVKSFAEENKDKLNPTTAAILKAKFLS